jgi:tRNA (guanine37-N1)-methyltransferase
MTFHILTLFPEAFDALNHSIIKRAKDADKIIINPINIRNFAKGNQRQTDDYPYGGGAGMVMMCEPIYNAYASLNLPKSCPVVFMTPTGKTFKQQMAHDFAKLDSIVILCGHYEGIDQRIIDEIVTHEISLGDFVLSGGELCAMVIIDAIARLLPNVLGSAESLFEESFSNGLLEYPQYTRPYEFMGRKVPDVLLSGHHSNIANWRKEQSIAKTLLLRPDLL